MPDQKVQLKIGADTTEVERAFSSLIKKMQGDADKLRLSPSAQQVSPRGAEAIKSTQLADLQSREYAKVLKGLEKELSLIKEIGREREKLNRQEHIANIQKSTFQQQQRASGWAMGPGVPGGGGMNLPPVPPGGGGKPAFGSGGISGLGGLAMALGAPAMAVGAAATAVIAAKTAEEIRRFFSESTNRARVTEASAFNTQGQAGQRLESILNGGASNELMFDTQRSQANQIAQGAIRARYETHNTPMGWAGFALRNPIQAARQAGGLFNSGLARSFEANKAQEAADYQQEQFEAIKNGPEGKLRTAVGSRYLQDYQRNLAFQRQMGLGTGGFRGGFLGGVQGAGFTDEQGMGAASGIMGAGGSTRAASGNAAFALQMGREFGLTNAGQAIGAISGQMGSSQMSKDALIKIQAEGTRIGVNQADFVEENRRFVEMAANVVNQSSVNSGAGVDQIIGTLGRFMGERTTSGLAAGQSAYEAYQRQSNTQSGPSAIMRAAGMIKNPALRTLSGEMQASLFTMNERDVNVDNAGLQAMANGNPAIIAAAKAAGMSPTEYLVQQYKGIQGSSAFVRKNTDAAISNLKNTYKNNPLMAPEAEGAALNLMRLEPAAQGLSEKAMMSMVRGAAGGTGVGGGTSEENRIRTAAESNRSRLPEDETNKQQAEASRLANGLFMSFKDSITPATGAVREFAASIDALMKAMGGDATARSNALQDFNRKYPGMSPSTQPSSGPPASGPGSH